MAQNIITQIIIEALYKDKASGPAKDTEKKLTATFNNIQKILGISVGAYSVKQLADFALQTARLAGENDNLRQSYENLAQVHKLNADLMLGKMQAASNNTINSMELMKQANNAMLLDLPVTENEMALLTEAGYKLGKAMGVDAAKGLESLTVGIGRQSRLWLDNLGIVIDTEAGNKKYADSLGKTAGQLTEAEKKTAFYNSAIEQIRVKLNTLGPVQETATDKIAQANKQVLEAKIAFGELFAPAVSSVSGALGRLAKTVGVELRDAFEVYKDESDRVFTANQNQYSQIIQISSVLENYAKKEKLTADELKNRHDLIGQLKTISPEYFGQLDAEKSRYEDIALAIGRATDELIKKIRIESAQKALADVYSKIIELQSERLKITSRQAQVEADLQNYWKDDQAALRLFNMTIREFNELSPGQQKLMIDNVRASVLYDERLRQINVSMANLSLEIKSLIDSTPELKKFFDTLSKPPTPAPAPAIAPATVPGGETPETVTVAESEKENIREQFRNRYAQAIQGQWSLMRENLEREVELYRQAGISETEIMQYYAQVRKQIAADELSYKAGSISQLLNGLSSMNSAMKGSAIFSKRLAQTAAIIDTYSAANKALASGPPPWNFIQMAAVIASGLANVATIQAQKFAEGAIFKSPVFSPVLKGGAIAGEVGPEAILPLRKLPSLIDMSMKTDKIESRLDQVKSELINMNQNLSRLKFSVQIGDKEIYASNERIAASRRRTGL